jgi:hypothetical protein
MLLKQEFRISIVIFWLVTRYGLVVLKCHPENVGDVTLKMEVIQSSETLVTIYKTIRRYNPEERDRNRHCGEKLRSQKEFKKPFDARS